MDTPPLRRAELLGTTLRRLLRRGGRAKISRLLSKERPGDVAVSLRRMTPSEQFIVFEILIAEYPDSAGQVLTELEPDERAEILEQMKAEQVAKLLEQAPTDDAVYLIDSLPEELKAGVLEIVDLEEKLAEVQTQLSYRDDSAGRIMDPEFVALDEETTASEAIEKVRETAAEIEMISYLYVVNENGHLLGVASLRQLLLARYDATLGEIMNPSVVRVSTSTDREDVAKLAARYDLLAIPVVDDDGKLVGIVTVDDIIDVFEDEATEDFFKMAGTSDDELVYQDQSLKVAGIRLPWLLFNLFGLLMAGLLTARFEETFDMAILIGFVPVIMGMAGNIGSQTSTITVRGLATGRLGLDLGNTRHFLWQQLKVGLVLGATCSAVVATVAMVYGRNPNLAVAVGCALFLTIQVASVNGALVPVLFKRLGIDPAVASGPLVTTSNDILGILIYFTFSFLALKVFAS